MKATTVFYQECPVCGRNLRIAVKYYGRPMSCAHCQGEFLAGSDTEEAPACEKDEVTTSVSQLLSPVEFSQPQLGEV